jgi:hypothetical protein
MKVDIESETKDVASNLQPFSPRTALGQKLIAIRNKIMAEGEPLLDWQEIEKEVADRRGGYHDDII